MSDSTTSSTTPPTEEAVFYAQAFSRNSGLLSSVEQEKLRQARVAIAGLGGVGGIHALSFARLGIGKFTIADKDVFETVNINRQAGAVEENMGVDKALAIEKMIQAINPFADVRRFSTGVTTETVAAFLRDADIVVDGLDFFAIDARRLLYAQAKKRGLYVVTAGPVGFGATLLAFDPQGMSFDDYFDIHDGMSEEEMALLFGIGIAPTLLQREYFKPEVVNLKKKTAPSLVMGTLLAANFVTTESVKILLGKKVLAAPHSVQFDPYVRKYKKVYLRWGNRHPLQRFKKWFIMRQLKRQGSL